MQALDRHPVGAVPASSTRSQLDLTPSKTRSSHPFSPSVPSPQFNIGSSPINGTKISPRDKRTRNKTGAAARNTGVVQGSKKGTSKKASQVAQNVLGVEMQPITSGKKRGAPSRVQNPSSTTQSPVVERHEAISSSSNRPVSPRVDETSSSNTASSSIQRQSVSSVPTLKHPRIETSGQGVGTRVLGVFSILGAGWLAAETALPGITNTVVSSIFPGTQDDYTAQRGLGDRIEHW